jgi:hypothetical protein
MVEHLAAYHSHTEETEPDVYRQRSYDGRVSKPEIGDILYGIVFENKLATDGGHKLECRTPFKTGLQYKLVLDRNNIPVEEILGKSCMVQIIEDLSVRGNRKSKGIHRYLCKLVK